MRRLSQIQERIERPTCVKLDMLQVIEMTQDQPAALPDGEGAATDEELHQAYINALSDRDHVVAVLAAWIDAKEKQAQKQIYDAVEKHLQANKPNHPPGRADTNMGSS
ncbi:TPA: hypothetical protein ACH3X1_011016 [Trebouxia sp. C0004]